ncbi:MAG: hypothetical protein LBR37_03815 [Erysipelotrichaceae bacterium]|jgi:hypothetical protein|nr:hypothetical protein [Erysipelotrichaceae bacterium]
MSKEFKRLIELTEADYNALAKFPCKIVKEKRRESVLPYYYAIVMIGRLNCRVKIDEAEAIKVSLKLNLPDVPKEMRLNVRARLSFGEKTNGEKYHLVEVTFGRNMSHSFFLDENQVDVLTYDKEVSKLWVLRPDKEINATDVIDRD